MDNLELVDGQCHFEGCAQFSVYDWGHFLNRARCDQCKSGWGSFIDEQSCAKCTNYYDPRNSETSRWEFCTDCSISNVGEPIDCTSCLHEGQEFLVADGEYPLHQCAFPRIEHCMTQPRGSAHCHRCNDGFWWNDETCSPCMLEGCSDC